MTPNEFFDLEAALREIQNFPAPERLGHLLALAGCQTDPAEPRIVTEPSAKLAAVGGLPLAGLARLGADPAECIRLAASNMGCAGALSYLALPGGDAKSAYSKIAGELGHFSIAHAAHASVFVAGATCAVENEFNSQRDLVHMARITEARTSCQDRPSLVCLHPALNGPLKQSLSHADALRAASFGTEGPKTPDEREAANLLYPACKATAFLVSGTLRGFQKLLAAQDDPGKEAEYRKLLGLVRAELAPWWPELFGREPA